MTHEKMETYRKLLSNKVKQAKLIRKMMAILGFDVGLRRRKEIYKMASKIVELRDQMNSMK